MKTIAVVSVFHSSSLSYWTRYVYSLSHLEVPSGIRLKIYVLNNSGQPLPSLRSSENIEVVDKNIDGFAPANNALAKIAEKKTHPQYFLFLNPDTEIFPSALTELILAADEGKTFCVDGHQWPLEHPKWFDSETKETSWCSGCCLLVRAKEFINWGGFRESFFMYAEDVDLSWRAWEAGYQCRYAPKALCVHHFYGPVKNQLFRQYWNVRNGIAMRYIHGEWSDCRWYLAFIIRTLISAIRSAHLRESLNLFRALMAGIFLAATSQRVDSRLRRRRPSFAQFFNSEYDRR